MTKKPTSKLTHYLTIPRILFLAIFLVSVWPIDAFAQEWESAWDSNDVSSETGAPKSVSHDNKTSEESEWEEAFANNWEALDVCMVNMITSIPKGSLSDDERNVLLETLLDSRYRFVTKTSDPDKSVDKGFVEDEFVDAWDSISPIMKKHMKDQPPEEAKKQQAFISASDALVAKEKAQPEKKTKIDRKDFNKLTQTLKGDEDVAFDSTSGVNQKLRDVLGIDDSMDAWEVDSDAGDDDYAAKPDDDKTTPEKVTPSKKTDGKRKWIVSRSNLDSYLERIKILLKKASDNALKKRKLEKRYHDLYRTFVLSAAWQESLYRQFVEKKGKIEYLRSYNDTSVGMMQINEKVWRGLYDIDRIRWDIRYNAMVGCEIANLYLGKYIMGKMRKMNLDKPIDDETLSRALYAMYNGGPGQFHKFLKRDKEGKYWKIDRYYYQKYRWVRDGQWQNLRPCLFGK